MMSWREELIEWIRTQALPVEKYGHQPRLYALTRAVGDAHEYDDDVVFAAVWLHDLGVFTGHRPEDPEALARWDNTLYAMEQAPPILKRLGFPAEKVAAVVECIRTHQPQQEPESIEATIVRDADILEQVGAVGGLRTICKVGRDTRFNTFTDAVRSLDRAVTTLPGKLKLARSRELAAARVAALRGFLDALVNEAGEQLY